MIPVLSRAQSHVFDRTAIEGGHVPSIVLMENAGRGVVDALEREWKHIPLSGARAVVVAGSGNNGGDGFVIARHLRMRGAEVEVFCTRSLASVTDDARTSDLDRVHLWFGGGRPGGRSAIPALSRAQSRAFDRTAIECGHVPSIVLMENAGLPPSLETDCPTSDCASHSSPSPHARPHTLASSS